ncbi:carbohydrate-binding protein [Geoalkalibacter halelectricus]|uniref:carbohydrate-binding protein n=1 Tax=Geoalkalibacter halelectricus TaxID=2847045 RepID=UPI003D25A157
MRKRVLDEGAAGRTPFHDENWLDLEQLAEVEITSEDAAHPIENALLVGAAGGWKAGAPGVQKIRLLFSEPQPLRRILLEFQEAERERNQEFVLRWSPDVEGGWREIVRQQFGFSPGGATREIEDYRVEISAARMLELEIDPDRGAGSAYASLQRFCLA